MVQTKVIVKISKLPNSFKNNSYGRNKHRLISHSGNIIEDQLV